MARILYLTSSNLLFKKDIFSDSTLSHTEISTRVLSEIKKKISKEKDPKSSDQITGNITLYQ